MGFKLIMCFGTDEQDRKTPVLAKWRRENIGDKIIGNMSQYYKVIN